MPGAAACGGDSIAYLNFCKGYSGGNQYYNYSGCNGVYTPVGYKTQSGTYSQTINTGCGCFYRKYYTVNLTRPTVYRTVNACGQYTFGDSTYTSSGVYTHTFDVDSTYCDSTVILTLNLIRPTVYRTVNACGQYTFGDSTYTSSGVYTHTFDVDSTSCDSTVILTLNLDTIFGCTDSTACNYDPAAICDDGSCTFSVIAPSTCESFNSIGNWTNTGWMFNSGSTQSYNTGPSDDFTGGGTYIYYETSTGYVNNPRFTSECFDFKWINKSRINICLSYVWCYYGNFKSIY